MKRLRLAWVHRWAGLVLGALLIVVFAMGTLSVYDREIDRWMMPSTRLPLPDRTVPLDLLRARGETLIDASRSWSMLLPDARSPFFLVSGQKAGRPVTVRLAPSDAAPLADPGTLGATGFFFPLHFNLMIETAEVGAFIVAFAGVAMLWLLVSGIVIHRSVFKNFFTLRLGPPLRRLALDVHAVTGLVMLPFHVGITLTGLAIFASLTMPAAIRVLYPNDETFDVAAYDMVVRTPSLAPAPAASLDAMVARAERVWGSGRPFYIHLVDPHDRSAIVVVRRAAENHLGDEGESVYFDGATGELLRRAVPTGAVQLGTVLGGAHMISSAGAGLRALYFLAGLAASLMIATGFIIYVEKLPATSRGRFVFDALALASTLGLVEAVLAYLVANRVLPAIPARAGVEGGIFFAAWLVSLAHGLIVCRTGRAEAWRRQAAMIVALSLSALATNVATTGDIIVSSIAAGQAAVAGVDLALLFTAAAALWSLSRVGRARAPAEPTVVVGSAAG